ncbi:hypothetical protein M3Y99_00716200 [Aphelenchoides fujianensis]|nr:hypothetical protein M3Y99_00716200 [Aphelenchoides fujianensis]
MSAFGDPLIPLAGFVLGGQPLFLAKPDAFRLLEEAVEQKEATTGECAGAGGSSTSSAIQYVPMGADTSLDYATGDGTYLGTSSHCAHSNKQYRCLCGACHIVLATKMFLVFYGFITVLGLIFGMVSAMVWTGIPIGVIIFTIYGFWKRKHKYFYPFLIISVVQLIVCLIMGFVIALFAIFNYETLKMIIAYNMNMEPSATLVVAVVGGTVVCCCLLAIVHVWQVLTIYACLQYYEYDLRPDRALIATHAELTNCRQPNSGEKNGGRGSDEKPSHAQTAPAVVELGLGSTGGTLGVGGGGLLLKPERSHVPTTDFMA